MSKRRTRCPFTVPASGGGDRCRRYAGHVQRDEPWARWHLPDCGSAVTVNPGDRPEDWITSRMWISMFNDVQRADGIVRSLRIEINALEDRA